MKYREYFKEADSDFQFPEELAIGSYLEYNNNIEIKNSFESFFEYYCALQDVVCASDHVEYYLLDSDGRRFGCIVLQAHEDIHYGSIAVASVLWIPNEYKGDPEVARLIVSIFKKFCKDYGIKYYKRVSKITPYIHKHIVKEVK